MSHDAITMRIALVLLGLIALACIGAGTALLLDDKSVPDAFIALASSGVTAIGLLLTRPIGGTQDVNVVGEPLQVTETPAPARRRKAAPKG